MKAPALSVLVLALFAAACGSSTPTSPTDTPPSRFTEVFAGTLAVKGSTFYSYTVTAAGPLNITLSSLMVGTLGPASTASVGVGMGVPAGTDCSVTSSMVLTPSLAAQIANAPATPGIYCVSIFDTGAITGPLNFAILINHS